MTPQVPDVPLMKKWAPSLTKHLDTESVETILYDSLYMMLLTGPKPSETLSLEIQAP